MTDITDQQTAIQKAQQQLNEAQQQAQQQLQSQRQQIMAFNPEPPLTQAQLLRMSPTQGVQVQEAQRQNVEAKQGALQQILRSESQVQQEVSQQQGLIDRAKQALQNFLSQQQQFQQAQTEFDKGYQAAVKGGYSSTAQSPEFRQGFESGRQDLKAGVTFTSTSGGKLTPQQPSDIELFRASYLPNRPQPSAPVDLLGGRPAPSGVTEIVRIPGQGPVSAAPYGQSPNFYSVNQGKIYVSPQGPNLNIPQIQTPYVSPTFLGAPIYQNQAQQTATENFFKKIPSSLVSEAQKTSEFLGKVIQRPFGGTTIDVGPGVLASLPKGGQIDTSPTAALNVQLRRASDFFGGAYSEANKLVDQLSEKYFTKGGKVAGYERYQLPPNVWTGPSDIIPYLKRGGPFAPSVITVQRPVSTSISDHLKIPATDLLSLQKPSPAEQARAQQVKDIISRGGRLAGYTPASEMAGNAAAVGKLGLAFAPGVGPVYLGSGIASDVAGKGSQLLAGKLTRGGALLGLGEAGLAGYGAYEYLKVPNPSEAFTKDFVKQTGLTQKEFRTLGKEYAAGAERGGDFSQTYFDLRSKALQNLQKVTGENAEIPYVANAYQRGVNLGLNPLSITKFSKGVQTFDTGYDLFNTVFNVEKPYSLVSSLSGLAPGTQAMIKESKMPLTVGLAEQKNIAAATRFNVANEKWLAQQQIEGPSFFGMMREPRMITEETTGTARFGTRTTDSLAKDILNAKDPATGKPLFNYKNIQEVKDAIKTQGVVTNPYNYNTGNLPEFQMVFKPGVGPEIAPVSVTPEGKITLTPYATEAERIKALQQSALGPLTTAPGLTTRGEGVTYGFKETLQQDGSIVSKTFLFDIGKGGQPINQRLALETGQADTRSIGIFDYNGKPLEFYVGEKVGPGQLLVRNTPIQSGIGIEPSTTIKGAEKYVYRTAPFEFRRVRIPDEFVQNKIPTAGGEFDTARFLPGRNAFNFGTQPQQITVTERLVFGPKTPYSLAVSGTDEELGLAQKISQSGSTRPFEQLTYTKGSNPFFNFGGGSGNLFKPSTGPGISITSIPPSSPGINLEAFRIPGVELTPQQRAELINKVIPSGPSEIISLQKAGVAEAAKISPGINLPITPSLSLEKAISPQSINLAITKGLPGEAILLGLGAKSAEQFKITQPQIVKLKTSPATKITQKPEAYKLFNPAVTKEIQNQPTIPLNLQPQLSQQINIPVITPIQVPQITQPTLQTPLQIPVTQPITDLTEFGRPRVPSVQIPPLSFPGTGSRDLFPSRRGKKKSLSSYLVYTRKKGKLVPLSTRGLPLGEAVTLGSTVARKTARASFKLVPTSRPAVSAGLPSTPLSALGVAFRPGKRPGEFIQPREQRIKSAGEIREISLVGAAKRKGSGKKGSFGFYIPKSRNLLVRRSRK